MKRALHIWTFFFLILSGCQTSNEIDTDVYVATALAETAAMETLVAEEVAATVAAFPTKTLTPAPTLTPTLTPIPPVTAQVIIKSYCRPGPGSVYGSGRLVDSGVSVMVVGKLGDATWLLVHPTDDNSSTCWIANEVLAITGDTAWVEVAFAPPTPTPISDWNGNWRVWFVYSAGVECTQVVAFTQTGDNFSAGGMCNRQITSYNYSLQGVVSANRMTVVGTYTNPYGTNSFRIERNPDNLEEFRGRVGEGSSMYQFCGTRITGGSKPDPCLP